MRRIIIFTFIIILLLGACSRRPGYVMSEKKMVDVLVDIQLAQAIYIRNNQFYSNDKKDALIEGILKKHKITQAELDSSLVWYADNIAYYETINDSVASMLRTRSNQYAAYISKIAGQDNPQRIIPAYFNLNRSTPTISFDIDSNRIKTFDIPKFKLKFNVFGLSDFQDVEAAVYFRYKDTIVKNIIPIDKNQLYVFDKPNLADSLLESISGYVHLRDKTINPLSKVMLYNISYMDSVTVAAKDSLEALPVIPVASRPQQTEKQIETSAVETAVQETAQESEPAELPPSSIPERVRNKAPEITDKDIKNDPALGRRSRSPEAKANPEKK